MKTADEVMVEAALVMLQMDQRLTAAESRIAAALACHARKDDSTHIHPLPLCVECLWPWDTEADRCTSPTVTALTPE